ncbi:MAG: diguanylate cyclase [Candidatus Omnitrophota bacterium]
MYKKEDINILLVEDDAVISSELKEVFELDGYGATAVNKIRFAKEELKKRFYNIVLSDLRLPDGTGLDVLKEAKDINEETIVMIFTAYASLDSSLNALENGVFAYFQKPLSIDDIKVHMRRAIAMQQLSLENRALLSRLKELSLKDPHTELYNYRYLKERLAQEIKTSIRTALPLSLIMIDIDYFKSINDVYGHQYGDQILKDFAKFIKRLVRGSDIVTRYGGEEFIIILPNTDRSGANVLAGRIMDSLRKHIFDPQERAVRLRVSLGISFYSLEGDGAKSEYTLINAADKAMLMAKELGGDRIAMPKKDVSETAAETLTGSAADKVERLKEKLSHVKKRVSRTLLESVYAFAKTIETQDYQTGEHKEDMDSMIYKIGKNLDLNENIIENLLSGAALHDLGKVGIPDKILFKKGKLERDEFDVVKEHPRIGAEIIRHIHFLKDIIPIILYHHERWDGKGYPSGLKGGQIPLAARIIAVVDVYYALVSNRPYRKAYTKEEAVRIIKEGSGTQFDPEIVTAFLKAIECE